MLRKNFRYVWPATKPDVVTDVYVTIYMRRKTKGIIKQDSKKNKKI